MEDVEIDVKRIKIGQAFYLYDPTYRNVYLLQYPNDFVGKLTEQVQSYLFLSCFARATYLLLQIESGCCLTVQGIIDTYAVEEDESVEPLDWPTASE